MDGDVFLYVFVGFGHILKLNVVFKLIDGRCNEHPTDIFKIMKNKQLYFTSTVYQNRIQY